MLIIKNKTSERILNYHWWTVNWDKETKWRDVRNLEVRDSREACRSYCNLRRLLIKETKWVGDQLAKKVGFKSYRGEWWYVRWAGEIGKINLRD